MVKGFVIQFRRGRRTQHDRHFLIEIPECDSREKATKYKDKEVSWTSPGKEKKVIKGVVSSAHGNSGVLRCIFERGLPGQSIGTEVEVEGFASDKGKKVKEVNKTDVNSEQEA